MALRPAAPAPAAPAPVVLALTASGEPTARRAAEALGAALHGRRGRACGDVAFDDTAEHVRTLFAAGVPIVGVCAAGILIRAAAPLLSDKRAEPPVVALAEDGSAAVPLLGGHRGANALARRLAAALGGAAAVTTAGDLSLGLALDAPPEGWRLANPEDAGSAMAAALAGGVRTTGPVPFEPAPRGGDAPAGGSGAVVGPPGGAPPRPGDPATDASAATPPVELLATEAPAKGSPARLVYHPRRHVLGLGCARGADPEALWALVSRTLAEAGVAPGAVAAVATIALKADEAAILEAARRLGAPLRLFDAAVLEAETPRLVTPSEVVFAEVGAHGVAEAAALACAGPDAALVVPKRKTGEATCALARAPAPIAAPRGRPRGRVAVVGIGPGRADWRTPEVSRLVAGADELVGYGLYLDLLGPLAAGKPVASFPLGGEEARCRHALERAGEGCRVALVCSGDAGVYAMASLVFETIDRGAVSDAAARAEVVVAPGVSAMQAAAARAGAPLGHDFCAISLSDLLTPREAILRRVRAAAEGDFAVAFYNPVSKRRRTLLGEARDLLLARRPPDTPVVLAASLGRPEEAVRTVALEALTVDEVDMLTLVIVGSSETRRVGARVYTPRGYAAKSGGAGVAEVETDGGPEGAGAGAATAGGAVAAERGASSDGAGAAEDAAAREPT